MKFVRCLLFGVARKWVTKYNLVFQLQFLIDFSFITKAVLCLERECNLNLFTNV